VPFVVIAYRAEHPNQATCNTLPLTFFL